MMVGSNETRFGFMDEGFAEYVESHAVAAITNTAVDLQDRSAQSRGVAGSDLEAPMMWATLHAGPNSTVATYSKGKVALNALGAIVGDSEVKRAFAEYALAWKWKHPSPWDFFFSMNKSLGKDLGWFWHGWFFTNYTFDQSIESVKVEDQFAVVSIRDKADLAMPIILRFEFTDGSAQVSTVPAEVWFGGSKTFMTRVPLRGRTLKSVTLDPDNRFQDLVLSDNFWPKG